MSKLKEIREAKGWSQSFLANKSGVNVRLIQDYEQEHKNINNAKAITVQKLAEALGCMSYELLEEEK